VAALVAAVGMAFRRVQFAGTNQRQSVQFAKGTRLMIKDRNLSYSERLNRLNITALETRRLTGNLIQVFKIFKGLDNVQHSDFFTMASTELRGHELQVYKPQVHLDIGLRKYFFSVRIVDAWNSLPAAFLRCNNVGNFKRKLD